MTEYIDRNAAIVIADYAADEHPYDKDPNNPDTFSDYNRGWNDACDYIRDKLESERTADVKQVRHGQWVRQDDTFTRYKCSVCLSENHGGYEQYCSICGSKMKLPKGVGRLEIPH